MYARYQRSATPLGGLYSVHKITFGEDDVAPIRAALCRARDHLAMVAIGQPDESAAHQAEACDALQNGLMFGVRSIEGQGVQEVYGAIVIGLGMLAAEGAHLEAA